jgi:hypothetical protein
MYVGASIGVEVRSRARQSQLWLKSGERPTSLAQVCSGLLHLAGKDNSVACFVAHPAWPHGEFLSCSRQMIRPSHRLPGYIFVSCKTAERKAR